MEIQLLYFDGCPSWKIGLKNLEAAIRTEGISAPVKTIQVADDADASRLKFLGSPSFRVDGRDLWPEEREHYSMSCRVYPTTKGLEGNPTVAMLRQALREYESRSRSHAKRRYIPALSFAWLTPVYDPLLKWGMREQAFKRKLIAQADLRPGMQVLDLGCGTGTLTVMLKQSAPEAHITGLDGDPQVLAIARDKALAAGAEIRWKQGMAYELPYPDDSFDWVVSSLVIHHLMSADKQRAFREVLRVLRPGGEFHLLDFGPGFSLLTRLQAAVMKNLEEAADNFAGRTLPMLREAGFDPVQETAHMHTLFGPIALHRAVRKKG